MTRQKEIAVGVVIGQWRVVSETPTRGPRGLMWTISCPNNHEVAVEHGRISYGATPTQCAQCVEQAATQRSNERLEEKRLSKEIASMMIEQRRKEKEQVVSIAGLAEPDETLKHTRAIYLPAEQAVPQQESEVANGEKTVRTSVG
jgi:hypothetical protein